MSTSTLPIYSAATADSLTVYWDEPGALIEYLVANGYTPRAGLTTACATEPDASSTASGPDEKSAVLASSAARLSPSYTVLLNDKELLTTQKTHATFTNLQPETTYTVRMQCFCGDKIFASASTTVTTRALRKRIDVSLAPYNAVGDGKTLNTAALQKAFDACTENDCVYIPRGVFMTGALRLHSGTELYLDEGAVLQGTENLADYLPYIHSRFEGIEQDCYQSLLNLGELDSKGGYNCHDVLIHGKGTIAGGGAELAKAIIRTERERLAGYLASLGDKIKECEHKDTIPGRMRGRLINMSNCQNVRISGLLLANAASWNVHFIYSDGIVTDHCTFKSEGTWNGDGWDPDSSTNCTIFACKFFTEDDSVAIKSGKNPQGNEINRPTEHIRVFDCRCYHGHGITIGSEISGGINDIRIWDCDMSASMQGIEIKATKKRGAYVRGVQVHNCSTSRLQMHSVGYNDDGIGAPLPPVFENCTFTQMTITGRMLDHERLWHDCAAIDIRGFDVPGFEAHNIVLDGILLEKPTAEKEKQAVAASVLGTASVADAHVAALAKNVANVLPSDTASPTSDDGRNSVQTVTLSCCKGVSMQNICVR